MGLGVKKKPGGATYVRPMRWRGRNVNAAHSDGLAVGVEGMVRREKIYVRFNGLNEGLRGRRPFEKNLWQE